MCAKCIIRTNGTEKGISNQKSYPRTKSILILQFQNRNKRTLDDTLVNHDCINPIDEIIKNAEKIIKYIVFN
jgi:hypothetical protein